MEDNNGEYKIKVNRTEKELLNKFNYKNKKYLLKKPILYNLKFTPEVVVNEFHQISNNINTNINIKRDKLEKSIYNGRNNYFDEMDNSNNGPYNKYNYSYDNNNLKRNKGNSGFTFNKTFTNIKRIKNNFNTLKNEKYETIEDNYPFSSRNHYHNSITDYNGKYIYIKNIKLNQLTKHKSKISDYIIPKLKEEIIIKKFERPKTERNKKINKFIMNNKGYFDLTSNIYSNERKYIKKRIKYLSQEEIISNKDIDYNKKGNISMNFDKYNKKLYEKLGSNTNKKIKEVSYNELFTFNNNWDLDENKIERSEEYKSSTYSDWKNYKTLNIKLMNYRIKLFKQFYIHFEKYYKAFIKYYKIFFLKKLKSIQKNNNKNNYKYTYHKKSRNYEISCNYNSPQIDNRDNNLFEFNAFSTTNNYYSLKKNKHIYLDIKTTLINKSGVNNLNNFNSSLTDFEKKEFDSTERKEKDINCLSDRKHFINKGLLDSIIKSPLKKGSQTSKDSDLEKEKELFRNLEELNKKEEQIIRRKKSRKEKDNNLLNSINRKSNNTNNNLSKIKNSNEYNQFSELRKQLNKKNNFINKIQNNNIINRSIKLNFENKYNETNFNCHSKKEKDLKINNIKNYNSKNKISNSKEFNFKKVNNSNIKKSLTINSYKKVKINNNKKSLIYNKEFNNIKNYKPKNIITNNTNNNKNNYSDKKKLEYKKSPKLIKEIITKDKKIHINIFYYNYNFYKEKKTSFIKFDSLSKSKNFSLNLNQKFQKRNINKKIKSRQILSSIKEEEMSNQNSKILDENINSFELNNINNFISHKEFIILQFINVMETILINIYKRIFLLRIKTIYIVKKMDEILFNNDKKKIIIQNKNKNEQIYNKKLAIKVHRKIKGNYNKDEIEIQNIRIELWNKKIDDFKRFLILYSFNKKKKRSII